MNNALTQNWPMPGTKESDGLTAQREIFSWQDPKAIAHTLKQSAEASRRRRSTPFRSAMSMLTFYINRAGETLDEKQRKVLEQAKDELRLAFGRAPKD
jgi:hypothetical protein